MRTMMLRERIEAAVRRLLADSEKETGAPYQTREIIGVLHNLGDLLCELATDVECTGPSIAVSATRAEMLHTVGSALLAAEEP